MQQTLKSPITRVMREKSLDKRINQKRTQNEKRKLVLGTGSESFAGKCGGNKKGGKKKKKKERGSAPKS